MFDDQFAHLVNDTARSSWNRVRQQLSGKLFYGHMHLLLAEYFTVTEAGMGVYRSTVWHQLTCSSAVFAWSWPLSALYFSPGVVFMLRNWGQRSVPAYLAVISVQRIEKWDEVGNGVQKLLIGEWMFAFSVLPFIERHKHSTHIFDWVTLGDKEAYVK